jgi:hypothetical protein
VSIPGGCSQAGSEDRSPRAAQQGLRVAAASAAPPSLTTGRLAPSAAKRKYFSANNAVVYAAGLHARAGDRGPREPVARNGYRTGSGSRSIQAVEVNLDGATDSRAGDIHLHARYPRTEVHFVVGDPVAVVAPLSVCARDVIRRAAIRGRC